MDLSEILKTIHVLGAAAWVGGAAMVQVQAGRVRASGDAQRMITFADEQEVVGKKYFAPVSGITALAGIFTMIELYGVDGFKETWIVIGIGLFVLTSIVGAAFLSPESGRLRDLVASKGIEDAEVQRRLDRITLVSRLDLLVLVLLIVDMVIKPGA